MKYCWTSWPEGVTSRIQSQAVGSSSVYVSAEPTEKTLSPRVTRSEPVSWR